MLPQGIAVHTAKTLAAVLLGVVLLAPCVAQAQAAAVEPVKKQWTITELQKQALETSPVLKSSAFIVEAARGRQITAGAIPNPTVDFLSGSTRPRADGTQTGTVSEVSINQPIEWFDVRRARQSEANARLDASQFEYRVIANNVLSDVRLRALEWLIRSEEIIAQQDAINLIAQTRQRVQVRVESGESPRYELIKAEAELLSAQARLDVAKAQAEAVRLKLSQQVGLTLPPDIQIAQPRAMAPDLKRLDNLVSSFGATNSELQQKSAELAAAQYALEQQTALKKPALQLQAKTQQDSSARLNQLGLVVNIPIFDQRKGPIREAQAELGRSRTYLEGRRFELSQQMSAAYAALLAAQRQVDAIDGGLLKQAEAALRVAEAAYKFGERGILDTLDAQRVLRVVRSDLLQARLIALSAAAEIDRLAGTYLSLVGESADPQGTKE